MPVPRTHRVSEILSFIFNPDYNKATVRVYHRNCRIKDFDNTVAILFCEDFGGSHYDSHPLQHKKSKHKFIVILHESR